MTPKARYFAALVLVLAGAASASPASTPARTARAPGTPASTPARTERAPGTPASTPARTARAPGTPAAQDVAGAWNMSYSTRDGARMASTLTLTIEGDKLTGTISSPRGTIALDEVSVKGDDIGFAVIRVGFGDRIRIDYTGKVKGDTMTLKMKVGAREPMDITAKRGG